ncbi:MAG: hypothetical protein ACLQUZ_18980 [Rhizomicrobium sp.]
MAGKESYQLASYRRCAERISVAWPAFLAAHADRLRHGNEAEKVAEAIIEDLLTQVLDWDKGDLMYQVGYADIVVSRNLVKYLIIEVKRPGTLLPGRKALDDAVAQARRYAGEQKVRCVAATDGRFLYAADVSGGGLADRVLVDLTMPEPPLGLWWLSVHGVYRACDEPAIYAQIQPAAPNATVVAPATEVLLHPKYKLPARCFAYVKDASKPATWKLPYLLEGGGTDHKRLPKAIQAILSNYRGAKVRDIPEADIPGVLLRLAKTATAVGLMPPRAIAPAQVYQQLANVIDQLGLRDQVVAGPQ